jgi:hypothetical protein
VERFRASNTKPQQLRRFAVDRLKNGDVTSRYYDELESELQCVQAKPLSFDEKCKKLEETIQRVATNTIGYTRKQSAVIQQAWTSEILPKSWTKGVLCPVYKKGDKLDCKNYRGICLLNVTYKVFAKILYDRLLPHANAAVQHYQAGFQSGKSTTDQNFALRQILEKCNEFNITTHHLFIDFKAAYDIIIRNEVYVGMSELNFPTKYTVPSPLNPDKN